MNSSLSMGTTKGILIAWQPKYNGVFISRVFGMPTDGFKNVLTTVTDSIKSHKYETTSVYHHTCICEVFDSGKKQGPNKHASMYQHSNGIKTA